MPGIDQAITARGDDRRGDQCAVAPGRFATSQAGYFLTVIVTAMLLAYDFGAFALVAPSTIANATVHRGSRAVVAVGLA